MKIILINGGDIVKFRHEYKFYLNYSDFLILKSRLDSVLDKDKNIDEHGEYKVRSLYFDNLYDKVLKEKLNGVNNREKFRIRYYNDDDSFIRLEKKTKENGMSYKVFCPITKEECEKILENDLEWMLESKYDLIKELYIKMKVQLLKPKTIVEYIRVPYIYSCGNVRITLDRAIRTGVYCNNLFDLDVPMLPLSEEVILVEVKYDEYLPEFIRDLVDLGNHRVTAFSKYAACRMYG